MNNVKTTAIITAGGKSKRFGENKLIKKMKNSNLSVIEYTISKFIDIVDEIVIPATLQTKEFILNSEIYSEKIKFAPSGSTRQISVYNGLLACKNTDIVLIHDGARPYISKETIKEAIELTKIHKAVITGKMATDTIKLVENDKIVETLDRNKIFHAQTPQCFDCELIKKIHEKYKNTPNYTDDSAMAEAEGINPHILISKGNNDKITVKEDLI